MTDWGDENILTESRSLILSQMCASKFSYFLMSDRLLVNVKKKFLVGLATWPWVPLAPRAVPG